jgi:hypothetical protein
LVALGLSETTLLVYIHLGTGVGGDAIAAVAAVAGARFDIYTCIFLSIIFTNLVCD